MPRCCHAAPLSGDPSAAIVATPGRRPTADGRCGARRAGPASSWAAGVTGQRSPLRMQ